jgi:hypothetical protein
MPVGAGYDPVPRARWPLSLPICNCLRSSERKSESQVVSQHALPDAALQEGWPVCRLVCRACHEDPFYPARCLTRLLLSRCRAWCCAWALFLSPRFQGASPIHDSCSSSSAYLASTRGHRKQGQCSSCSARRVSCFASVAEVILVSSAARRPIVASCRSQRHWSPIPSRQSPDAAT